jgi:16S rRNA (adenine1518-N6/adenine1519-N6)-dimethyltransferase
MARRLGQHFLRPASVERLLRVVGPRPDEVFLEIGPGAGALTLPLAARVRTLVAVELDAGLAATLRARAPANVSVLTGDALTCDARALVPAGARLVGNLPYYISSPLLRRALEWRGHVRDAHLMVQLEVAARVAAAPGSRDYGVLSVLAGLWAEVDMPLRFAPGAFVPPPRVQSALLRLRLRSEPRAAIPSPEAFERVVFRAFAQRRRTLENNLRDSYPNLKQHLRLLNIEGQRRAETLGAVEFAALATSLESAPHTPTRGHVEVDDGPT